MGKRRKFVGTIGRSVAETQFAFETKESPSKGKPNVIYIVLDDTGFAQLGCYGSTIHTPNIDRLAYGGLRYNNFHTTAICSATRASLLTGANHHSVGVNTTTEGRTGLQNAQGGIDPQFATLAEILKEYDYRTMAVGKWHLSGMDERTAAGPYHNWPLGKGFDTYYGFLAADNEDWAEFLAKNRFLVGLSLDGPKKIHDCYRTGIAGEGTFEKVMHTVELFDNYHVEYNILSVVTNESAKKASYLYKFFKRHGFSYLQFIPCMDEMNRKESNALRNEFAVEPVNYGKFLCEMFDLWYEDFCSGYQMDIRMFSNLAQMAAGFPAEECGMNGHCNCYFVVEGDGSVYPCDFYCMDEWKLGTVENGFWDMLQSKKAEAFVASSQSVSEKCKDCKYFSLCKGGCRRWREPFVNGTPGLNYLCEAYEIFFEHTWERIQKLGQYIEKKYGIR